MLNAAAAGAMDAAGAHACTDVSGFGLLGHLGEMLHASGPAPCCASPTCPCTAVCSSSSPRGLRRRPARQPRLRAAEAARRRPASPRVLALFDPQTSGGLLVAVAPERRSCCWPSCARAARRRGHGRGRDDAAGTCCCERDAPPSAERAGAQAAPRRPACSPKRGRYDGRHEAERRSALRGLAAVDEVLREPAVRGAAATYPRQVVVDAVRAVMDRLRREILEGGLGDAGALTPAAIVPWVGSLSAAAVSPSLRRVINATGVVVHTNLGRAVLPRGAVAAVAVAAGSLHRPGDEPGDAASAPRGRTTCATCCAPSPAPRTPWWSTTTPRPCCWRWRPPAAAARCRLARPAGGDRRRLPHSRHPARERRRAGGGGHHQPHVPARRRARLERAHARGAARAHQQLPHRRLHRRAEPARSSAAWPTSAAPCCIDDLGSGALADCRCSPTSRRRASAAPSGPTS